jgi:uroporphyrinogen III methyltransferase / synthase
VKPLAGLTILVTRSREPTDRLSTALSARGARVVEAPVIALEEPEDWSPADLALSHLSDYDITIFTSANSVERFAARMARLGLSAPPTARIFAIGPATARALHSVGMTVGLVAPIASAEGVLELLEGEDLAGVRVLIPRAQVAREILPEQLRRRGARVEVVTVYRTVAVPVEPEVIRMLQSGLVDVATFTSSSAVRHLLTSLGGPEMLNGVEIAVIGPVTARAALEAGLTPTIVPEAAGMEELAEAIAARYDPSS